MLTPSLKVMQTTTRFVPVFHPQPFTEAASCFLQGVRDAVSARALLMSLSLWFMASAGVLIAFLIFWERIKVFAIGAAAIIVLGLSTLFPHWTSGTGGVSGGGLGAVTGVFFSILGGWFLILVFYLLMVAIAVRVLSEWLLMGRIQKQVLQAYRVSAFPPRVGKKHSLQSRWREWGSTWCVLLLVPLCLLLPLIGSVAFFVLLSYLNARFLVNEALADIADEADATHMASELRMELLIIGLMSALINVIPLVGFVAPWATGAAVCHLTFRRLALHQPV